MARDFIFRIKNGEALPPIDPSGSRVLFNEEKQSFEVLSNQGVISEFIPGGSSGGSSGGTTSVVSVTYDELLNLVNSSSLSVGSYYIITDFQTCYDQPDYDYNANPITSGNYRVADVDPIMVFATSNSTLSDNAYQPSYPKDRIKYDITFTATEVTESPAKGRISERIDEYNNRTDYDHRAIKFKRYTTYFLNNTYNGRVTGFTDGSVYGYETDFINDLAEGSVIFIESNNPKFYKVTSIASATEMLVEGYNYDNFTNTDGFRFWSTNVRTLDSIPGSLYYFNDVGEDDIDDGGNDMYDGGNRIYTNLYDTIPYTHTQMTDPPVNDNNQAVESDFAMDGAVEPGDSYFGAGSQYFTNSYPGLFVMVANDVTLDEFYIDGGLGSDGNGQADLFDYTLSLSGNDFSVYCKRIWDAGDPSVNHIFIVNTIDENITHDADLSTEDDYDKIAGLNDVTQVHYLLFGLSQGVKATNTQIQNIVLDYLSNVDLSDINNTLSNLNINYSAVTANVPPQGTLTVSLEYKQNNFVDTDYYEQNTFSYINYFSDNYIGNYASTNNDFLLSNNVFANADDNTVDVLSNNFGDLFHNNSFGDDVISNLFVGQDFYRNTFYDRFRYNIVKDSFGDNVWYEGEFNHNNIGTSFYDNWNTGSSFRDNVIGNDFNNNKITGVLYENNIGNNFEDNTIKSSFNDNIILNYFNTNTIYCEFRKNSILNGFNTNTVGGVNNSGLIFENNQIMDNFKGNNIQGNFWSNQIKADFKGNEVFDEFGYNNLGYGCSPNIFSGVTTYNNIGNYFVFNVCYGSFSFNTIGTGFNENNIQDGFGFGGSISQGNKIGNNFESNTIGEYFYNNTIADNFIDNTIVDNFQQNDVTNDVSGTDFTLATFVYAGYNCNIFRNSDGNLRLSYYNNLDQITVTNINN